MEDKSRILADLTPQQRERLYELLKKQQKPSSARVIEARNGAGNLFPLSFGQERLWFLDQLEPGSSAYNMPGAFRLHGKLEHVALQKSLGAIIQRHEVLRTLFVAKNGQPQQYIRSFQEVKLPVYDLTSLSPALREAEIERLIRLEVYAPFDLASGPLLRVCLLRSDVHEHILLLTMHHIISDGWSIGLFIRELSELYTALVKGRPPQVSSLAVQYADFALWQRQWRLDGGMESQLAYWKQQLKDLPLLALPTDHPRPAIQRYRGTSISFSLPGELSQHLKEFSLREGVTLFMTLLAAFQVLLARYSAQEDIGIGTPVANRTHAEIEGLIGFFVNTLVLRTDLSGEPGFREVVQRVKKVALGAYAHQDLPFDVLVETLQPERDPSRNPLFQVLFQLNNTPVIPLTLPGLTLSPLQGKTVTAKFDLTLDMMESEDGLVGLIEYNTDLFDTATIERLLGHWQTLLVSVVTQPELPISRLELLTASEREQLLTWTSTAADYPKDRCIHQLFEDQVEYTPATVALSFDQLQITYEHLNTIANQLAHRLQKTGMAPESAVGVYLEQSPEFIVALLAVLKAGGVYVPLAPDYPQERLAFMLHDAQISTLLTQQSLLNQLPAYPAAVICLDVDQKELSQQATNNLDSRLPANALAYVIYTSGSTGTPKGVAVPHQAVTRLVMNTNYIQLSSNDRVAQASNTTFDAATFEIWGALLHGAQLTGISRDVLLSPPALATALQRLQVTALFLTTALFNQVMQDTPTAFRSLRYLLFGGEAVTPRWVEAALTRGRPEHFLHVYGPTENTTFSSWYPLAEVPEGATTLPIGFPIAHTQVYVLDRWMQPVAIGLAGELYLGGDGLARGYLGRADLTAERFVPHPFVGTSHDASGSYSASEPGARLYRTGDVVRYLPDGSIEFLGRLDHQVKIRGFRIELGEIEAILAQHPAVRENVVIVHEGAPGAKQLVAYIVVDTDKEVTSKALRAMLQEKLPAYMLPAAFVFLEELPLTANGKLDRRKLPLPDFSAFPQEHPFVAPRDTMEMQLALIWEEVLQVNLTSITANFFELGGHSLLAVQLMARIEQQFGQRLPLALLFQEATIERLAAVLRQEHDLHCNSSIVGLQTSGTQPALFLLPAGSGSIFCYLPLVRYWGQERPLYGLQTPGLYDNRNCPTDLRELAAHYIQEIRSIQPEGPYHLAGWCGGGTIAHEMTRQLQESGQTVAFLALLDTAPPTAGNIPDPGDVTLLIGFAADFHHLLGESISPSYKRALFELLVSVLSIAGNQLVDTKQVALFIAYLLTEHQGQEMLEVYRSMEQLKQEEQLQFLMSHPWNTQVEVSTADLAYIRRLYHTYCNNARAIFSYAPQIHSGRVILMCASHKEANVQKVEAAAWQKWTTEQLYLYSVPGDHYTMLKEPHVRVLATMLKEQIELSHWNTGADWQLPEVTNQSVGSAD